MDTPAEANEAIESEEEDAAPKEPPEDANHSDEDKTRGKVRVSKAERRRRGWDFLGGNSQGSQNGMVF